MSYLVGVVRYHLATEDGLAACKTRLTHADLVPDVPQGGWEPCRKCFRNGRPLTKVETAFIETLSQRPMAWHPAIERLCKTLADEGFVHVGKHGVNLTEKGKVAKRH